MKFEITQKGAHGKDGELEVGTVIDLEGDTPADLPAYLIGKGRILGAKITNPAEAPAASSDDEETMKALRAEYKELSGKNAGPKWDGAKLRSEIEALNAEAAKKAAEDAKKAE